jgi:hypothetical protein
MFGGDREPGTVYILHHLQPTAAEFCWPKVWFARAKVASDWRLNSSDEYHRLAPGTMLY